MPYYVAFDVAHKPRGRIDENLTQLRDYLNSNDFICYNFLEVPITEESLKPYDILVFVCPDFSKISSHEIAAIVNWIEDSGGGLLLLSHAGGDKGRGSNLSEVSDNFGIIFENDQVLDETQNLGLENIPLISSFNIPHPITTDIDSLCYRSGCSLSIVGSGAFSIADSNETSEPFSCPLICVSETGNGRVCCIGSYEMLRDKVGGGFQCNDHSKLALNIFQWLISDYRIELRSKMDVPTPVPQTKITSTSTEYIDSTVPVLSDDQSLDIDISIKISKKSELMKLLKTFKKQINTMKKTVDKLIDLASTSEEFASNISQEPIPEESFSSEGTQKIGALDQTKKDFFDISEHEPELSALPPKPDSLKKSDSNEDSITPAPILKPNVKDKTKKELKNEKKGLESKLTSVQDLLNFIDKKHSSGKLNDDEYSKRSKKLQADMKKTKKRIDFLDKLLEK